MTEEIGNGRAVGVEPQAGRKTIGGEIVEVQLARLDSCITWAATTVCVVCAMDI
jgi:hypothetical protein